MIIEHMEGIETHKNNGFTLIELIVVLLIIAIISAVVVSRYTGTNNELIGQVEVIKSHLRYAQSKAMSSTSSGTSSFWHIHFETTPAQYTLYKGANQKYFPGETNVTIPLNPGISLSGETYILFDDLGRPYPNNTGASGTQLTTVKTIITSSAGNIEIKPETGFIP